MAVKICQKTKTPSWKSVNFSVGAEIFQRFRSVAKERGQTNLSGLVSSLMQCYCQETCADCPELGYVGEEHGVKIPCKAGILRMAVED